MFRIFNSTVLKTLFSFIVRPKLEYASLVWYSHYNFQKLATEKVQSICHLKLAVYIHHVDYNDLLNRPNVISLESRRVSVRFLKRLVRGGADCPTVLSQIKFAIPMHNIHCFHMIKIPFARSNVLRRTPLTYMVINVSELSADLFIYGCDNFFFHSLYLVLIISLSFFLFDVHCVIDSLAYS